MRADVGQSSPRQLAERPVKVSNHCLTAAFIAWSTRSAGGIRGRLGGPFSAPVVPAARCVARFSWTFGIAQISRFGEEPGTSEDTPPSRRGDRSMRDAPNPAAGVLVGKTRARRARSRRLRRLDGIATM